MSETLPDRLSTDPDSPHYDADVLGRNVGVRFRELTGRPIDRVFVRRVLEDVILPLASGPADS